MERSQFARHLEQATAAAVLFARRYVTNELPEEVRYLVRSEVCDAAGVVERLWRDGEVPVWIDLHVERAEDRFAYLRLCRTSRTSGRDEALRYQEEGYPPFQPLGPSLPPGWEGLERTGKFDFHWPRRPGPG